MTRALDGFGKSQRRPSRVLMTVDAVGGVWRYAMDLGAALGNAGVAISFAGLGPSPSPAQVTEAKRLGTLDWLDAPLDWTVEDEAALEGIPRLLLEVIRRRDVDLVHLNLPSQACGLKTRVPVVVVSHSCVATWFQAVRGEPVPAAWHWQARRNRAGFDAADAVLAPSHAHAEALLACYGPIDTLKVIHNAVAGGPEAAAKERIVFAAGRWWDDGKNGTVLDQAAANAQWPVLMAGPTMGPSGQAIRLRHALAAGELQNAEVRQLMGRAGIVVSPSLYEPFGLAVLEAAHAQAALVLADIPTYRELWDEAAVFADPRRPEALAAELNRLAADARLRQDLGRRARKRAERFSPAAQAAAVMDVYGAAMSRSPDALRVAG